METETESQIQYPEVISMGVGDEEIVRVGMYHLALHTACLVFREKVHCFLTLLSNIDLNA